MKQIQFISLFPFNIISFNLNNNSTTNFKTNLNRTFFSFFLLVSYKLYSSMFIAANIICVLSIKQFVSLFASNIISFNLNNDSNTNFEPNLNQTFFFRCHINFIVLCL